MRFILTTVAFVILASPSLGEDLFTKYAKQDDECEDPFLALMGACAENIGKIICKKNFFSNVEEFLVSINETDYFISGKVLDNMPPWHFYRVEEGDDFNRLLVINFDKKSYAMVTETEKFSTTKGYYKQQSKYYCRYEEVE